jgi:NAD(P)-dependent dehydrogenase (short-subunit alcohol dehydrogenase family)
MNIDSMQNKIVIITGATKGMGLASSLRMLEHGANVVMVYCSDTVNAKQVEIKLSSYTNQILLIQADITKVKDRQRILDLTLEKFKQVDVLVNNAGVAAKSGFLKEQEDAYELVLDVNLKSPIFLAQLVAKQMIKQNKGGAIINFSSISGHRGAGGISYDAAKAGIIRATQTMANALGQYGIRVNSISPGAHKTEMNRYHWENETGLYKKLLEIIPLKRMAEAVEITGTVVYLASDQSSYTTGADILVDGGYLSLLPGRET